MIAKLDHNVGNMLSNSFRLESRRSFLARLTRGLFAIAGVTLSSSIPADTSAAETEEAEEKGGGARPWEWCGLHGYLCEGNCSGGTPGSPSHALYAWVACCRNPSTNRWRCVRYFDQCGRRGPKWGRNCRGPRGGPSGPSWCGGASGSYVCTRISVEGNYESAQACARGCRGPQYTEG